MSDKSQEPSHIVQVVGTIMVKMHDTAFIEGYRQGRAVFQQVHQGKTLTDSDLYEFLVGGMVDVQHSGRWNAGRITGWMSGLFEKQPVRDEWLVQTVRVELEEVEG